jgi:hypothetical protein
MILATSAVGATVRVPSVSIDNGVSEVVLAVALESPASEAVASAQFELRYANALSVQEVTPGQAALDAGKSVVANEVAPGRQRVIVAGLNQTRIEDGALANVLFTVAAGTTDLMIGVELAGVVLSDPAGRAVPATLVDGVLTVGDPDGEMVSPGACGCGPRRGDVASGDALIVLGMILLLSASRVRNGGAVPQSVPGPDHREP